MVITMARALSLSSLRFSLLLPRRLLSTATYPGRCRVKHVHPGSGPICPLYPINVPPLYPTIQNYDNSLWVHMQKPGGEGATKQQMIDCYVQTLAKALGSEEEAKKKIFNVSCDQTFFGFGCEIDEETIHKLKGLPGVNSVAIFDPEFDDYFAELLVNGEIVQRPPERCEWLEELKRGNENRFFEHFRMRKHVFNSLVRELVGFHRLRSRRHVGAEESVAMFLYMIGHGSTYREVAERFQLSEETVRRQFHWVLKSVDDLGDVIIKPEDMILRDPAEYIEKDERYWPYFRDCMGAIDCTHIAIHVSPNRKIAFTGRNGVTTTNVLVVCDLNMCFTYALIGWEGSAHDTKIFVDTQKAVFTFSSSSGR